MWIGTSRGLSRFLPLATPAAERSSAGGVHLGQIRRPDRGSGVDRTRFRIAATRSQVPFAALTFVQESSVLFRYRLVTSNEIGSRPAQRELNYPQLPSGQYTLEVMARNAHGEWSAEPAPHQLPDSDALVADLVVPRRRRAAGAG